MTETVRAMRLFLEEGPREELCLYSPSGAVLYCTGFANGTKPVLVMAGRFVCVLLEGAGLVCLEAVGWPDLRWKGDVVLEGPELVRYREACVGLSVVQRVQYLLSRLSDGR